jgi:hypothetical protein
MQRREKAREKAREIVRGRTKSNSRGGNAVQFYRAAANAVTESPCSKTIEGF